MTQDPALLHLTAQLSSDARVFLRPESVDSSDFHASLHRHLGAISRTLRTARSGVPLHASACVLADGRGVLAAGNTEAGKSTLVALLGARSGATFVSDNTVWLEGTRVSSFGAPLAIRSTSPFAAQAQQTPYGAGADRVMVAAADLGIGSVSDHTNVAVLLFPSFGPGPASAEPVSAVEAFCRLVGSLLRSCSDDELLTVAQLAARCPATAIGYHDEATCLAMCAEAFAREPVETPVPCATVPGDELTASGFGPDVRAIRLGDDVAAWSPGRRQIVAVQDWPAGTPLPTGEAFEQLRDLGFVSPRTAASA